MESRSTIRPDDRGAWFASYTAFISHYAAMAQRLGVEQFAVGSELVLDQRRSARLVTGNSGSTGSVSRHRAVCGRCGDEAIRVPFWDAVDMIGIDAYFPLSTASTTDVSVLQRSWEPIRAEMAAGSARYGRKILFTEAGFTSQEGTTTAPNNGCSARRPTRPSRRQAIKRCWRPSATRRGGRASTGGSGTPCRTTEATTLPTTPLGARPPNG